MICIKTSENFVGTQYNITDEGNPDVNHFTVQTDKDNVITSVRNNHTDHWAVMQKEYTINGDLVNIVKVFSRSSKGEPAFKGKAEYFFNEERLDNASRTAVRLLQDAYQHVRFCAAS